jgi:hypothetical protein
MSRVGRNCSNWRLTDIDDFKEVYTSNVFNKTLLAEYPMHILGLIAGSILVFIAIAISWTLFVEYPDDFQVGIPEAQFQEQYRTYLIVCSVPFTVVPIGLFI